MDPDGSYQLLVLVVLVITLGLLTAMETAFLSLNRLRVRNLASEPNPYSPYLDSVRVGHVFLIVAIAAIGTAMAWGIWGEERGTLISILFLSLVILVFGKALPESVGLRYAEKVSASLLLYGLKTVGLITLPLAKALNQFKKIFSEPQGSVPKSANGITEEEIINLVAASQQEGMIYQEEKTMIHSIFEFNDIIVRDVMVPRPDIVAVEKGASYQEIIRVIRDEKFSRIPVYDGTIDNILGVIHIKDLLFTTQEGLESFSLLNYLRQPFFVPETKKIHELFSAMKKEKTHMAIVLDEYGSTAGLVTMEDLIEEIMGDIQDEHDSEEPLLQKINEHTVEVNASLRIDELNERIGLNLVSEEADTIGGLVFTELDRVPAEGDTVQLQGIELTVQEMDGHRIEKVRLTKTEA